MVGIQEDVGVRLSICEDVEFLRWRYGGDMGVGEVYEVCFEDFGLLIDKMKGSGTDDSLVKNDLRCHFPFLYLVDGVEWGEMLTAYGFSIFPPFGSKRDGVSLMERWGVDRYYEERSGFFGYGDEVKWELRILYDLECMLSLWGDLSLDSLLVRLEDVFRMGFIVESGDELDDVLSRYGFLKLLRDNELEKVLGEMGFVVEKVPRYVVRKKSDSAKGVRRKMAIDGYGSNFDRDAFLRDRENGIGIGTVRAKRIIEEARIKEGAV